MFKTTKQLSLIATILAFIVITLGAYTRLKDAGLGCPDWPGCYGQLIGNFQDNKAWIEMIHRYVAGSLGILVLIIAITSIKIKKIRALAFVILFIVIAQALLGMWTVTLGLYPIIVVAHLLGGFTIFALLWLMYLKLACKFNNNTNSNRNNFFAYLALIVLIIQIFLGGWTSANYAGLVCADFPTCQGQLWPNMDWRQAFNLTEVGIFASPGTPLENPARVTIQMAHRLGAIITILFLGILSYRLFYSRLGKLLLFLLISQVTLGICNVLFQLPLAIGLLHNTIAALLLITMVTILYVRLPADL